MALTGWNDCRSRLKSDAEKLECISADDRRWSLLFSRLQPWYPAFASLEISVELCTWHLNIFQRHLSINYGMLELCHQQVSDSKLEQDLLSRCWKPALWACHHVWFHTDCIKIIPIAKYGPECYRSPKMASWTYIPSHNTISIWKLTCCPTWTYCSM